MSSNTPNSENLEAQQERLSELQLRHHAMLTREEQLEAERRSLIQQLSNQIGFPAEDVSRALGVTGQLIGVEQATAAASQSFGIPINSDSSVSQNPQQPFNLSSILQSLPRFNPSASSLSPSDRLLSAPHLCHNTDNKSKKTFSFEGFLANMPEVLQSDENYYEAVNSSTGDMRKYLIFYKGMEIHAVEIEFVIHAIKCYSDVVHRKNKSAKYLGGSIYTNLSVNSLSIEDFKNHSEKKLNSKSSSKGVTFIRIFDDHGSYARVAVKFNSTNKCFELYVNDRSS